MNFCSKCGGKLTLRVPPGDSLLRHICDTCGTIHYRNPLVVVGTIPEWEDRILLCRRAIEPRHGFWTLPAGFMELGRIAMPVMMMSWSNPESLCAERTTERSSRYHRVLGALSATS